LSAGDRVVASAPDAGAVATPAPARPPDVEGAGAPGGADVGAVLAVLRRAITGRRPVAITYQAANADMPTPRIVRPLRLEGHGALWYLHAYCTRRRAERVFRVDRIGAIEALRGPLPASRRPGRPARSLEVRPTQGAAQRRSRPLLPRASFFAPPPDPPPGSPLVRIWLEE